MVARLSAFVMWALVAACAVFWLLRFVASPLQAPPQTTAVSTASAVRGDLQRLLGAPVAVEAPVVAEAVGRFKLIGVMAPKRAEAGFDQGVALLTVDDKPPRAFRVGAAVEGDWVLQQVSTRAATIASPSAAQPIRLELPPLPAPATGQLTPAVGLAPAPRAAAPSPPPAFVPPPAAAPVVQVGDQPLAIQPGVPQPMANPGAPPPTAYVPPGAGNSFPPGSR